MRDGSNHGPKCVQIDYFFDVNATVEGSEDCLFLNVYTPQLPVAENAIELLPIMVWFHYGALNTGSGNSESFGPEFLMDRNVLLVTLNYRLGAFGFLSTGDDASPGNYGFKDQVAALRWVQENIANFGGDPGRVTIFGQSAGGGSVHHHLLSPLSKGNLNSLGFYSLGLYFMGLYSLSLCSLGLYSLNLYSSDWY